MKRKVTLAVIVVALVSAATAGAIAHSGATGVVKKRMDAMDAVGDAMKSLTAMMRGKETYDPERVRLEARKINAHSGDSLTKLFPEGSLQPPTEALPAIWTDWERFSELAKQLSTYATALQAAADNQRPRRGPAGTKPSGSGMMQGGPGMMQGGPGMMQGGSGMMQGGTKVEPSAEMLAQMPPDASFFQLTQTCAACHQDFRKKK